LGKKGKERGNLFWGKEKKKYFCGVKFTNSRYAKKMFTFAE
jgi:hypothetical protein